jgi:hypothetical protein
MEIESIVLLFFLMGLPIIWPFLLAFYISKKASVVFKPKRFVSYLLAGYGVLFVFLVLAFVFNSWLISTGYSCNYPTTVSFKILCSKTFLGFSNWYQSYLIYIPLWLSLVVTTIMFKRHANI